MKLADRVDIAYVLIWDRLVGAVSWNGRDRFATFEFDRKFLDLGLDLSPIKMPAADARRGNAQFAFRALREETFKGLPGMLADSLPDNFGNALIDRWLSGQGRDPADFSPVERLCYTGRRGMGALEYKPVINTALEESVPVEVERLLALARSVVEERSNLRSDLGSDPSDALLNIIRTGTSAGGNRPKAVIALNEKNGEVRSGQVDAPDGFDYWILKFDGVKDRALADPAGYGRIEYAYHLMAKEAGIDMTECRLLEEEGRAHFMTRRFDRSAGGGKLHLQSLCAIAHLDYQDAGGASYEDAFRVMRELRLSSEEAGQQFRRMVFNVAARNQDDHTKNIAFLMDMGGHWRLSPAFDVTYAYNPGGLWTNTHQMSINGKRDDFTKEDLLRVGTEMNIQRGEKLVEEVLDAVSRWPFFAGEAGVPKNQIDAIAKTHRLNI